MTTNNTHTAEAPMKGLDVVTDASGRQGHPLASREVP